MFHRYYYAGKSNRYNDQFSSDTAPFITWPYAQESIKDLIDENEDELDFILNGFKRCLYLERPDNSNSVWRIVIAVWHDSWEYQNGFEPQRIVSIITRGLTELLPDKNTGELYKELGMNIYYSFLRTEKRDFY